MIQNMFKALVLVLLLTFLPACSVSDIGNMITETEATQNTETSSDQNKEEATVNRVIDGDTVEVKMPDGDKESVRLLLIDTPESVHPDKPEQPYGKESSEYAKDKLPEGKKVNLEYDGPKRGTYDRLLAYIWVDGENFNQKMLEKGYARYAYEY